MPEGFENKQTHIVDRIIELDTREKKVRMFDSGGGEDLSDQEFAVLKELMEAHGREVDTADLLGVFQRANPESADVNRDFRNVIGRIRRKLARVTQQKMTIVKIRGDRGFYLRLERH